MKHAISPFGGELVNLVAKSERADELKTAALEFPSWDLKPRQQSDLELLMNGALSPLKGFMGQADYDSVVNKMQLQDGTLWPMPITLDVDEATAQALKPGEQLALRDLEGVMLAVLHIEQIWQPDLKREAKAVFGTTDTTHPGVNRLLNNTLAYYIGGKIEGVERPVYHSFKDLRNSPDELRQHFDKLGWTNVVAFHATSPIHKDSQYMSMKAARDLDANLLIHAVAEEGNDYYSRLRCYRAAIGHFPQQTTMLSLFPVSVRGAGPRELLWHAILRQNYGCTHMIVESGYADSDGQWYKQGQYKDVLKRMDNDLEIKVISCELPQYIEESAEFVPTNKVPAGTKGIKISDQELLRRLREGLEIPAWYSFPEVIAELQASFPTRREQGFTLFFTGLSGSGKSTIAIAVLAKLHELGGRPVTLLDGDLVRKHLSSELGFSKEHRNLNIQRIGYVASEITKNGGIAICAPIAPYTQMRSRNREMISAVGGFIEVYVSTPIETCEKRDRKGLYAKARAGIIKEFTGISDPYEAPQSPEIDIDTTDLSVEEAAQRIFLYLEKQGYII